jgi:ubiquinone/menaquinone biosynthesis C-methylase UbiE
MNDREVGRYWDESAEAWTFLARRGYDVYRDLVNTPAFFEMLPDVTGLAGLDVGCGEGHNTRLLAKRGAIMSAVDISAAFIAHAQDLDAPDFDGMDIHYAIASAQKLPFEAASFHFATAFMSLMDMPRPDLALAETARVLKTGGFFQFSISHPCSTTPHRRHVRDAQGRTLALEVGGYFEYLDGEIDEWLFSAAPRELKAGLRKFRIPRFQRTLSDWINMIAGAGLAIEQVAEPYASEETAMRYPVVADTRVAPYFLLVRCRKISGLS